MTTTTAGSLLPNQILPQDVPFARVGADGTILVEHQWWLFFYNIARMVLNGPNAALLANIKFPVQPVDIAGSSEDMPEPMFVPGVGNSGTSGVSGAPGLTYFPVFDMLEDTGEPVTIPGSVGPAGPAGPSGTGGTNAAFFPVFDMLEDSSEQIFVPAAVASAAVPVTGNQVIVSALSLFEYLEDANEPIFVPPSVTSAAIPVVVTSTAVSMPFLFDSLEDASEQIFVPGSVLAVASGNTTSVGGFTPSYLAIGMMGGSASQQGTAMAYGGNATTDNQ